MEENRNYGWYIFKGEEDKIAERWMWETLCSMKLSSRIKFCLMVIMKNPPKWVFQ